MPPKPVDKRNPLQTRDAIWAAIRQLRTFTASSVRMETRCTRDTVAEYLTGLTAGGYLEKTGIEYTLVRDAGIEAPRVRRDGTPVTMGRAQENMWRTMYILREFNAQDVQLHARTDETAVTLVAAKDYILNLYRAGYLIMIAPGKPGGTRTAGKLARYRLPQARYTGPRPPMVQRVNQVYDQNTHKVVWTQGVPDDAA